MADTQPAPQAPDTGSMEVAQTAILGLLDPAPVTPEPEESTPEEVEESTEETQDESSEEVSEDEPTEEPEGDTEEESDEESEVEEDLDDLRFPVQVNGEELLVPMEELIKGYSRHSDYTKKTQEVAEYRKQAEAAVAQAQAEIHQTQQFRQQYIDAASSVVQERYGKLQELMQSTDFDRLKVEDREEWLIKSQEKSNIEQSIQQETDRINYVNSQQQQEAQQAKAQEISQHRGMLESIIPEWKDPAFRNKVGRDLTEFGVSQGLTAEEVGGIVDHRHLLILMQAKAFQEMQNAQETTKAKKTKKKHKMVSSGTGKRKGEDSKKKRTAQMTRLKESGSYKDAASLLEDFV